MDDAVRAVREFIGADPQKGKNAWFTSNSGNGDHSVRQISTYIEGWTVYTVTQSKSLKLRHLESDPRASYLWVDDQPVPRRKNVWMKGIVDVISDQDEVAEFMARRAANLGFTPPVQNWERFVIRFKPTDLRAESFLGADAGNTPVVLKGSDFDL